MKNKLIYTAICCLYALTAAAQWVTQSSGSTTVGLNNIYAINATTAFVVGNGGFARKTTNAGTTWSPMSVDNTTFDLNSMIFTGGNNGYIVGDGQELFGTTNSGTFWSELNFGITDLYDISVASGQVWVCGDIEVGYGFLYNETTFDLPQPASILNKRLFGVYFTSALTGYAVGDQGVIIKTTTGGATSASWSQQTSNTIQTLNKIKFITANDGIAVGNGGVILKTTNAGANWQLVPNTGTTHNLNAVYYGSATEVWAVGNAGVILYSNDGGSTWTSQNSGVTAHLNSVGGFGTGQVWACGNSGVILYKGGTTTVCPATSAITLSNIANTSATITWPAVTSAIGYEYAHTTAATPPAAGTATTLLTAPLTGLVKGTVYYAHVRTKCGATDFSAWKTQTFTTTSTGIKNTNALEGISVYPNPAGESITISGLSAGQQLQLIDITGRTLLNAIATGKTMRISTAGFASGIYSLQINDEHFVKNIRLEKQ